MMVNVHGRIFGNMSHRRRSEPGRPRAAGPRAEIEALLAAAQRLRDLAELWKRHCRHHMRQVPFLLKEAEELEERARQLQLDCHSQ